MLTITPNFRSLAVILSLLAAGLLSIWALPGTIGLRHLLLGLGLISSSLFILPQMGLLIKPCAWPLWLLGCLYLWLLIHLAFFSQQFDLQSHELLSIWARSLASLPLGLALGMALNQTRTYDKTLKQITAILFVGFASTPIIFISHYLYRCALAGSWLSMQNKAWWVTPYLQKPPFVMASAILLPLCCLLLYRSIRREIAPFWISTSILAIMLCIISNYLTNTKNGMAIAVLTLGFFFPWSMWQLFWVKARQSLSKNILSLALIAILLGSGISMLRLHLTHNPAWSELIANIQVGIDIDRQNYWKNRYVHEQIPKNNLGHPVDVSTYERSAWFTAGLQLLADKPLGFGLIHHSFGWMAKERWPDFYPPIGTLRGMTHSGWLDLTLGIGIPGLLCILIPLAAAWFRSFKIHTLWGSYTRWTIPIFTFAYLTTETTGGHHFIELLIFEVAFFIGITLKTAYRTPKETSLANPHSGN